MEVKTDVKTVASQMNKQAGALQPPKQTEPRKNTEAPKPAQTAVADKVTISAQGMEAQKKAEQMKEPVKQTPKTSQNLVNTII